MSAVQSRPGPVENERPGRAAQSLGAAEVDEDNEVPGVVDILSGLCGGRLHKCVWPYPKDQTTIIEQVK